MGTIIVKHSKSLPVVFQQLPGDREDMQAVLEAGVKVEHSKGTQAARLLSVYGRHWDTISLVSPHATDNIALSGGQRAWIKGNALPLLRNLADVAFGGREGAVSKEEHDRNAPYYSVMAQGVLHCVSPFHSEDERLLTWTEFKEAVATKKGKEPTHKSIVRGLEVIARPSADGSISVPTVEACQRALPECKRAVLLAVAQVLAHMLGREELISACNAADAEAIEHDAFVRSIHQEQADQ